MICREGNRLKCLAICQNKFCSWCRRCGGATKLSFLPERSFCRCQKSWLLVPFYTVSNLCGVTEERVRFSPAPVVGRRLLNASQWASVCTIIGVCRSVLLSLRYCLSVKGARVVPPMKQETHDVSLSQLHLL